MSVWPNSKFFHSKGDLRLNDLRYGLTFLQPESVVDVVLKTDTTELDSSHNRDAHFVQSNDTPSPKQAPVPSTPSEKMRARSPTPASPVVVEEQEELAPPPVVRRLQRRVTTPSTAASREPSAAPEPSQRLEEPSEPPPPRRKVCVQNFKPFIGLTILQLVRRVNVQPPIVTGIDDPSGILDAPPDLSSSIVPPAAVVRGVFFIQLASTHYLPAFNSWKAQAQTKTWH